MNLTHVSLTEEDPPGDVQESRSLQLGGLDNPGVVGGLIRREEQGGRDCLLL